MIEKILERLETEKETANRTYGTFKAKVDLGRTFGLEKAIEIVQEVSKEYGNGWIPCSERLPELPSDKLVTYYDDDYDDYFCVVAIYSSVREKWINSYTADEIAQEVIAWQPLPTPYQKGE